MAARLYARQKRIELLRCRLRRHAIGLLHQIADDPVCAVRLRQGLDPIRARFLGVSAKLVFFKLVALRVSLRSTITGLHIRICFGDFRLFLLVVELAAL